MDKTIVIKNFSILKDVNIKINKINVVIGNQAQGKSTLAKLLYFINSVIFLEANYATIEELSEAGYIKRLKDIFHSIFPANFWNDKPFEVIGNISSDPSEAVKIYTRNNVLQFKIPAAIFENYNKLKDRHAGASSKSLENIIKDLWKNFESFGTSVFIPAGRSYFSTLQSKIFTMLYITPERKNDTIDYMIKNFGVTYERARQKYLSAISEKSSSGLKSEIAGILKGEYIFKDKTDQLIMSNNKAIDLIDSSSGQQEVLPIILTLVGILKDPFYILKNRFFFIEEPEAHLFPETQKKLVELFSFIHNSTDRNTGFFLTTHSPYILSSMNNLIQARNSYDILTGEKKIKDITAARKISKIVSKNKWLNFDDVSAYYLKDGRLADINNYANRLIDENAIDEVSDDISKEFGGLLKCAYGE